MQPETLTPAVLVVDDDPDIARLVGSYLKRVGFDAEVVYLQDLIRIDRNAQTLTTTRTYFSSLRAMLASFGIAFDKIAYTKEMFEALIAPALRLEDIGDIRFSIVDERCMGLAPHEFKALVLRKPLPS